MRASVLWFRVQGNQGHYGGDDDAAVLTYHVPLAQHKRQGCKFSGGASNPLSLIVTSHPPNKRHPQQIIL